MVNATPLISQNKSSYINTNGSGINRNRSGKITPLYRTKAVALMMTLGIWSHILTQVSAKTRNNVGKLQ